MLGIHIKLDFFCCFPTYRLTHAVRNGLIIGLIVAAVFPSLAAGTTDMVRPNILLIVVDSLRRDHMSCYGHFHKTTPNIDQLASEGALFEQAISISPQTASSLMSILTSVMPSRHKARATEMTMTLASELKNAGYETAAFMSSPKILAGAGFRIGFDTFGDFNVVMDEFIRLHSGAGDIPPTEMVTSPYVTRAAEEWLLKSRNRKKPFFLHLLYSDPCHEYVAPPPYSQKYVDPHYEGRQSGRRLEALNGTLVSDRDKDHIMSLYDGEVRYTDDQIGALFTILKEKGLFRNTIIVLTGSHGVDLWDHGTIAKNESLYDELIHVPLIVRYQSLTGGRIRIKQSVSHLDIMPTVLSLAGIGVPDQCEGIDLTPMIKGKRERDVLRFVLAEVDKGNARCIRTSSRKVIATGDGKRVEMYDLLKDPDEMNNLAGTSGAAAFKSLVDALNSWARDNPNRNE